jgi:hypothetical protein
MSDDLVERLRAGIHTSIDHLVLNNEAADRIEKLEAALRELLSLGEWGLNDLAKTIAQEALQEKEGA